MDTNGRVGSPCRRLPNGGSSTGLPENRHPRSCRTLVPRRNAPRTRRPLPHCGQRHWRARSGWPFRKDAWHLTRGLLFGLSPRRPVPTDFRNSLGSSRPILRDASGELSELRNEAVSVREVRNPRKPRGRARHRNETLLFQIVRVTSKAVVVPSMTL